MIHMTCDTRTPPMPLKQATIAAITSQQKGSEDNAVNMLLAKLDEGTQTVINLRSLLTLKTAELNELIAQLELTHQAITTVESTTSQIENMLKELGLSADPSDHTRESLLMNAEQCLDSAIKSATSIYPLKPTTIRRPSSASNNSGDNEKRLNTRMFTSKIKYKPDTKHILRKLNNLSRELELDSGKFFESLGTTDDYEILQKAYVDLDIAKTISLSAKSNMKRRTILLKSARRGAKMDEIKMLGEKIREGVNLWMTYTKNAPLLLNGVDITTTLNREDELLAKNLPPVSNRYSITPSNSNYTTRLQQSHSISESIPRYAYSRPTSMPAESVPTSPVIKPITTITPPAVNKKAYRQSAGARLTQVKASVGYPRVRTTSLTQKTVTPTPPTPPTTTPTTTKPNTNYKSNINHKKEQVVSPSSASDSTTLSTPVNNTTVDTKKSLIKPPAQRGPGSTLRLRSMLARRNQPNNS